MSSSATNRGGLAHSWFGFAFRQLELLKKDMPDHPAIPLLEKILVEFRDDELEHLDTAVANESQQAPAYSLLSAVIAGGCRWAIAATSKV